MQTVTTFPRQVKEIENIWIPLSDGVRLAARLWLPEDAEAKPVPAILEYLPYRKRDGTTVRDALTHPYFAGHGYAAIRVDMRGNGDSEGLLFDEYTKQEQDDAIEVIEWLTKQKWCSGSVGMIGISWGGFNGLQVAARKPPALKAIVTLCTWPGPPPCLPIRPDRPIPPWSAMRGRRCGWTGSKTCRCSSCPGFSIPIATNIGSMPVSARISAPSKPPASSSAAGTMPIPILYRD
ncbi:MAG: CocE/NonD family hydrolase [Alphaproteobacteria bacterium]|nr:MAG: CocE/NonD family hydrolase [Alphaproteobacteria bacterium]